MQRDYLKSIARHSGGDCRAAINDMQMLANNNNEITEESVKELVDRDKLETINSALVKVFKSTDPNVALKAFDNVKRI